MIQSTSEGLLVIFSGRPASGKSTIAHKLTRLIKKRHKKKVYSVSLDQWRIDHYKEKAFYDELINEMLKKLNLDLLNHLSKGELVILEGGGYTSFPKTKSIIINKAKNICEVRLECPLPLTILRDITRSLKGQEPRMKFVYIQSLIRDILHQRKIVLFGFNKPLAEISGLHVSTAKNSPDRAAKDIISYVESVFNL